MNKLRFKIVEGDTITLSPWLDEQVTNGGPHSTAAQTMAQLRKEHPHAAISIERDTVIRPARQATVRFKIDVSDEKGNTATFYSKSVPESEAETLRAEVESDGILNPFVKKVLTKEIFGG